MRIVALVTGAEPAVVATALAGADGDTKTAIVMLTKNMAAEQARQYLEQSGGSLRTALGE